MNKDKSELFKEIYPLIKNKKVLDIGCIGHNVQAKSKNPFWVHNFLNDNCNVLGIDILKDSVETLRKQGYNMEVANAETFELGTKFDVVFAGELIEHLSNPGLFLNQSKKHLKHGGLLILTTPNTFYMPRMMECMIKINDDPIVNDEHTNWFSPTTIRTLLEREGFNVASIKKFDAAALETTSKNKIKRSINKTFNKEIKGSLLIIARPMGKKSKPKVYLMSYANKKFVKNQKRLNESAKAYGIKNIISYTDQNLKRTKFYSNYKNILDQPRGAGYWLWKPFFIYKTMNNLNEGDILIYSDSGAVFINSPKSLLKIALKEKALLFTNNEPNIKWNKRKCLDNMGCNSDKYLYAPQVSAGFQVYVNTYKTRKFVKEWLYYCCVDGLIDDTPSNSGEHEEYAAYKEHRHDQSILTNIATKYNIPLYRDPSQGGNHLKALEFRKKGEWIQYPYKYTEVAGSNTSKYPTIINHLRNTGRLKLLLIKLHSKLPKWLKKITKKQ